MMKVMMINQKKSFEMKIYIIDLNNLLFLNACFV